MTLLKAAAWSDGARSLIGLSPKENGRRGVAATRTDRGAEEVGRSWWPSSRCSPALPSSRSTIFVRLHTNGNQELQYQPGDHLGVFPGNHEDLVNALIERLEDSTPVNQLVKVELLEERNTALGNYGRATPKGASLLQGVPKAVGIWGRGDLSSQSPFQVGEWFSVTPSLRDRTLLLSRG